MNGVASCNSTRVDEGFEEIEIPVPWGHISGKWWGPKALQPIIAIHGWQDNAGTFDNLAPLLKKENIPMLCIDLPGHGFSSHLPQGQFYYIFWDGVHILRRIVIHFGWKNITILGHSLGGAIAFLYAATFPDDVHKYISLDIASPSVRNPKKIVSSLGMCVDKFLEYDAESISKHYPYEKMAQIVLDAHDGSITQDSCYVMLRRGVKEVENKKGYYYFTRDPRLKISALGFSTMDQVRVLAANIKCTVLNIRASPGMKLEFPEYYEEVMQILGNNAKKLERHTVEGTHHVHLNDPERVAKIIIDFIKS